MNKYLKYLKSLLFIFIPFTIFNFIISILYYFNTINSTINNWLVFISIILSMLIGGIYIGNKVNKKGYLEGIKIGLSISILFFLISYLGFNSFKLKYLIYYLILLLSTTFGSMLGISKK